MRPVPSSIPPDLREVFAKGLEYAINPDVPQRELARVAICLLIESVCTHHGVRPSKQARLAIDFKVIETVEDAVIQYQDDEEAFYDSLDDEE